jgi:F-type H+-transporting ATPase subunit b
MLEILEKVGFDWQVALANFINFLIIFFVLKKFAFKPILKMIDERKEKIKTGLEDAEKAKTDLLMAEEIGKKEVSKAKIEANSIVGEAEKKATSIIKKSEEEALIVKSSITKEAEKDIEKKKESLKKELEKENANLIISSVEKLLKENITKEQQEKYIKNILSI